MRILLTGATGFIGKKMGQELVRAGHEVVAVVRDIEQAQIDLPFPAELISWKFEKPLLDIDAVIHLAGENIGTGRWSATKKEAIIQSRVNTTKKVLTYVKACKGRTPAVFLSASAIGIYGDRDDEWLTEESTYGEDFLADACKAWEKEVEAADAIVDRVVIFRLGMVLGRGGGALEKILPLFQKGLGGRLGSGLQWMSWVHVNDVVGAFIFALDNLKVKGIYNCVASDPIQNFEFTDVLAQAIGARVSLPAPEIVLKMVLGEMSLLVLGGQKVSSKKLKDAGYSFRFHFATEAMAQIIDSKQKGFGPLTHAYFQEQWIPHAIEEVYDFFSEAKNLEEITPPWLHFKILSQSSPKIENNTEINYQLSLHGIPFRWRTKILDWEPGKSFIDVQEKGPYNLWYHTHYFEPLGSGTLIRDYVLYKLPLGRLGALLGHWKVLSDIKKIFSFRKVKVYQRFLK